MEWRGRARGQEDYRLRRRRRNWRTKRRPERGEPRGGEKKTRCKKQREREGGGKVEERERDRCRYNDTGERKASLVARGTRPRDGYTRNN